MENLLFKNVEPSIFGPPSSSGVYAVCISHDCIYNGMNPRMFKERILYIGSSKNVLKRLSNLKHPYRICFDRFKDKLVYTKVIETDNYIELEKSLIKEYNPILNKQHKN